LAAEFVEEGHCSVSATRVRHARRLVTLRSFVGLDSPSSG
jgi:hypothetical protein